MCNQAVDDYRDTLKYQSANCLFRSDKQKFSD